MSCSGECKQGRNCDCGAVFQYHKIATILLLLVVASMALGTIISIGVLT